MSNKWLKACSVLPALLITPALADTVTEPTENFNGNHYFVSNGSTLTLGKSDVNYVDGVYSDWYHAVAGGVVQNHLGSVVVEDGTIFSNNASYIRTEEQDANLSESDGAEMGGAIYAQGNSSEYATTEIGNNVEFNGNIASAGGAIFLYGGNVVNFGDNVKFSGNKGTWNLPEDSFYGSSATGDGYGGAIASTKADVQEDPNKLGPDNGNAILTFKGKSIFEDNVADRQGGAISLYGSQATFNGDALFTGNTALAPSEENVKGGGAISATDSEFVFNEGAAFANNSATGAGGAIWNGVFEGSSSMTFNGSASFENNSANNGGAIYNEGKISLTGDTQFVENSASNTGGAIFNASEGVITEISNTLFQGNKAENHKDAAAELTTDVYAQGGAIYNRGSIGAINGDFINNSAHTKSETASKATANGGALALYQSTIESITGNFVGNAAIAEIVGEDKDYSDEMVSGDKLVSAGGGAIHIEGKWATGDVTKIGAINGNFENNSATGDAYANGGAIYIKAGTNTDVSIDNITGNFVNNKVIATTDNTDITKTSTGGAISIKESGHDATVAINGDFIGNSVTTNQTVANGGAIYNEGDLTVNGDFINNYASSQLNSKGSNGGAIYNNGILKLAENLTFSGNKADYAGGAIYNAESGNAIIKSSTFDGNSAQYGGAINNARLQSDSGGVLTITDSIFTNNRGWNGGAIRNQGEANIATINNTLFSANTSTNGGAIHNGAWGKVKIDGAEFSDNTATLTTDLMTGKTGMGQGGAITNAGVLEITNATFTGNSAAGRGGAIANVESGGSTGNITLSGTNTFANNTAAGVANDIYNNGTVTVASGTTTLGGGITGDGTLTIEDGATLNIGTTTVKQSEVTLDGTLTAQILNQGSYGRVETGNITVGDNGLLNLMFGSVGTYNFGVTVPEDKIVYNNAIYDATFGETGEITVAIKSVEEIAQGTNLSIGAANAVSIIANTNDDVLNTISLMAQQDLVAGKTGNAEKELAKLNPDDKPVAQSVASSVQNQVMSLAAGRMSGASVGRSGGDLTSADYGLWVQGLYNHSKYNGKFSGDTWGISVGADTLIDGKYTLGIGYAYNDTDVDSNSRDTGIESNSLFLYGQYKPNEWYVNAALNYTMANYDESADPYGFKRKTEYDVDSFGGQIMTGYDFASGFTPEVGMRYLHISQDAYQSWLGEVDALDTDYLTGVAGVKYAFEIESASELKFRPELRAAATYDFMSDAAVATVNAPGNVSYVIDADRLSRFGGEFGIGLAAQYRGLEVSLNYDLDLHEDYTSQTGMLKFRYDF